MHPLSLSHDVGQEESLLLTSVADYDDSGSCGWLHIRRLQQGHVHLAPGLWLNGPHNVHTNNDYHFFCLA